MRQEKQMRFLARIGAYMLKSRHWHLAVMFALALSAMNSMRLSATPFTQTSPAPFNLDLSSILPSHGGTHVLVVGSNGNYLASNIAEADLFTGFTRNSFELGTVSHTACGEDVSTFFATGIAKVYVRITLEDGDTASGNFDYQDNFLQLGSNGVYDVPGQIDSSSIQTQDTTSDTFYTGYPNRRVVTGWFDFTPVSSFTTNYLATSAVDLIWFKADQDNQFYDFKPGSTTTVQCNTGNVFSDLMIEVELEQGSAALSSFNVTTDAGALTFDGGTTSGTVTTYSSQTLTVSPGTFSLSEDLVPNHVQGNWRCSVDGDSETDAGTFSSGSIAISAKKSVVCRIFNEPDIVASDVAISKTFPAGTTYTPGGSGTYLLTLFNNGPDDVIGALVEDTLPAGTSLQGSWICDPTFGAGDGSASCVTGAPTGTSSSGTSDPSFSVDIPNGKTLVIQIPVTFSSDVVDY